MLTGIEIESSVLKIIPKMEFFIERCEGVLFLCIGWLITHLGGVMGDAAF